jgi:CDP-diacylglycerol--glycerol-3-phosphate 3-phosphatidyltransferase
MSIYQLKPAFQQLLRPWVVWLFQRGVTANQVTLLAAAISIALGLGLCAVGQTSHWFLLIPIWMLIRMALNAIDGMLAREFGQKSALGAYLNELTDVIADAALYLPFMFISPFNAWSLMAFIWLSALSEYAGVLGLMVGASRRYDGPLGKSDRAMVFGCLGLVVGLAIELPQWCAYLTGLLIVLSIGTLVNRIIKGLAEAKQRH